MTSIYSFITKILDRWSGVILTLLAFATISTVITLYYTHEPFLEAFEAKSYDLRFKNIRGPIEPSEQIAIVAIDNESISELGRFPWSRNHYIPLLKNLSKAGAKAVVFDALFSEQEDLNTDDNFANAIKEAGNVILATSFELDQQFNAIDSTHSLTKFENAAMDIGHINFVPEEDGINRRNILLINENDKLIPSLGLKAAMVALDEKQFSVDSFSIELGSRSIPFGDYYAMWINYTGSPGTYPRYSFSDVVKGDISPELLKDKVVFIGATALGVYDMRVTPYHKNTPGVEIHAMIADNIITNRFIQQGGIEATLDILFIAVIGLITFILTARLQLYIAIPLTVLLGTGYVLITYQFFIDGQWISIIYPLLAAIASILVGGSFRYLILERRAREMRSMFSSYISPKLVSRLEKEPDAAQIGGDSKEITIVFTDIAGFTTFAEKHPPFEVVARLNEYLETMVKMVTDHDGTVDKFMGDGIMIYWGAPLPQQDHTQLAIKTVEAMKQALIKLKQKWEKEGEVPFSFRAGINTGEAIAGNIGSKGKKMEYTVIGDTVNLAARLESTAKYYGVNVLISESSHKNIKGDYIFRELDQIRVLGKDIPVKIYELVDHSSGLSKTDIEQFHQGLELYRGRKWQDAKAQFESIITQHPEDKPSQIYISRCIEFIDNPPESAWDGVFTHDNK